MKLKLLISFLIIFGAGCATTRIIDDKTYPYQYYTKAVCKKISKNWDPGNNKQGLKAIVHFIIKKDGNVDDNIIIKESSGNTDYDTTAIVAIMNSSPFSPLPKGYQEDTLSIYFEFKCSK